jgi:hypothetical protein
VGCSFAGTTGTYVRVFVCVCAYTLYIYACISVRVYNLYTIKYTWSNTYGQIHMVKYTWSNTLVKYTWSNTHGQISSYIFRDWAKHGPSSALTNYPWPWLWPWLWPWSWPCHDHHKFVNKLSMTVTVTVTVTMWLWSWQVEKGRMQAVLRGCISGSYKPGLVEALRIVYCEVAPVRFGGDLIFKIMSKLVKHGK